MKILVVEDNGVTAILMRGILTRHGYTVVLARSASQALSLLGSNSDIQGVITDIMMPGSSGLDLLQALRTHPTWRNLPTIVTTGRDDRETVVQAVALGCKEYILKPINPAQLIERVTKVFTQERVILMNSSEVLYRYSLNSETYQEIAKKFAAQVVQAIAVLQTWSTSPASVRCEEFTSIMESATLLGAERLVAAIEAVSPAFESTLLTPLQCASLLEELQLVRRALSAQAT